MLRLHVYLYNLYLLLIVLVQHTNLFADGVLDLGEDQTVGVGEVLVLHFAGDDGLAHCLRLIAHGLGVGVVGRVLALGRQPLLLLAIDVDELVGRPEVNQLVDKTRLLATLQSRSIRLRTVTCPLVPLITAVLANFSLEEKRMREVRPPL